MKVAVLDDYQKVALEMADWSSLPVSTQVTVFNDHLENDDALIERLKDFEIVAVMRERTPFTRERMERLPKLRLLVSTGVHNGAIDYDAATDLGILVCETNMGAYDTAELSWGLILSLLRHIPQENAAIRQGRWQTTVGTRLEGKILGILGLGRLGSKMASIGAAFGVEVIAWSQNLTAEKATRSGAKLVTKDELFTRSDILTIHMHLSERSRNLVGARELGLMKPTAYLINTSRGPIVDEAALIQVLIAHKIAGAGLDVFDIEPLPPEHPFKRLDNVIMTPHLGYVTKENYRIYYPDVVEDISAYINGKPVRVLNPGALKASKKR